MLRYPITGIAGCCARATERPRRRAAEQRDELASFQPDELHPPPQEGGPAYQDRRGSSQGLAAMRNCGPVLCRVQGHKHRPQSVPEPEPMSAPLPKATVI